MMDLNNNRTCLVNGSISSRGLETDLVEVHLKTNVNVEKEMENAFNYKTEMLWNPEQSQLSKNTQLQKFQKLVQTKYNVKFPNGYADLYRWSIDNYTTFWEEFWHFSKIVHSKAYDRVLDKQQQNTAAADSVRVDDLPFKWFDGALLNYAENLLRFGNSKSNDGDENKIALHSYGESFKSVRSITFKQLKEGVRKIQAALKKNGVKKGDRVVGYLPNSIECVQAKLATISLGAIWSCTSPDFGPNAVTERFHQIEPKIIFSVRSVAYNAKIHNHLGKLKEVVDGLSSLEKIVIVPFIEEENGENSKSRSDLDSFKNAVTLAEFIAEAAGDESDSDAAELKFEQVPFYHPMVILFSSGTTGTPKCIVHSHGGTLIQHLKEHILQGNMTSDDIVFYYTTTGWMMYDWLLSSLAVGASVVLFDGSPIVPHDDILWDLVDRIGITLFGTSAKWLAVIEQRGRKPIETHKLSTLKCIYSTGSPLKPESFSYIYKCIKKDIVVGSITGGSDIISLFAGHNMNLPVYKGELQCRHLGMAVECWNENQKHVYDECGELVCTKPFPSMPVFFYGDDANHKKYRASYFDKYPGVWAHGDFCMINSKTGGIVMLGRSDGTLNPNGVRFGSADIYNVIEHMTEIEDSLCVGQKNPNEPSEERVILFVKLKESGKKLDKDLLDKIRATIRGSLSARHVPSIILQIDEIPYTLNGKKVEVPVRRILEGHKIVPSCSLANPKSLEQFELIEQLKKW